jgi:hypothetical protein
MGKFANKDSRSHIVSSVQYFLMLKFPLFSISSGGGNPGYRLIVDGEVVAEAFNDDSKWKRKNISFS